MTIKRGLLLFACLFLMPLNVSAYDGYVRYQGKLYVKQSIVIIEAPKVKMYDPYHLMMRFYVQKNYGSSTYRVERRVKKITLYIPPEKIYNPYTNRSRSRR